MLRSLLQNTRLYQQLSAIRDAKRSLRRAEHRAALRIKQAYVRSQVTHEIHRTQLEQTYLALAKLRKKAHIETAHGISEAHEKRYDLLRKVAESRGQTLPTRMSDQNEKSFKQRIAESTETLISHSEANVSPMTKQSLRESVEGMEIKGDTEEQMAVNLITSVAQDVGLSRDEMKKLLKQVETDEDDRTLRSAVLQHFPVEDSNTEGISEKRQTVQP